ncbi:hypothetical protein I4F81_000922 [Pyropia yezoensis]|uniref:Uncharacterized protein n=1 Tax=Pyropia yezoensis TaxID=2788 RepID=A0ACC3BL09_PYRYE|nr:hypothetical protein I4F81_000922 [Neopyropia yezoensis]
MCWSAAAAASGSRRGRRPPGSPRPGGGASRRPVPHRHWLPPFTPAATGCGGLRAPPVAAVASASGDGRWTALEELGCRPPPPVDRPLRRQPAVTAAGAVVAWATAANG